jgi:hypothetical protein
MHPRGFGAAAVAQPTERNAQHRRFRLIEV